MEPIIIGGVKVYVNQTADGKTNFERLPKEGDLNVIRYNGMTMKFPDQKGTKIGNIWHTPQIDTYTVTGETDVMYLRGVQIFGSEKDDKVYSRGNLEATYRFENGGADELRVVRFNDGNYTNEELNMKKTRLDSTDSLILESRFYDENNHWYMTRTIKETGDDNNDYKIKLLDFSVKSEEIPTEDEEEE